MRHSAGELTEGFAVVEIVGPVAVGVAAHVRPGGGAAATTAATGRATATRSAAPGASAASGAAAGTTTATAAAAATAPRRLGLLDDVIKAHIDLVRHDGLLGSNGQRFKLCPFQCVKINQKAASTLTVLVLWARG
jgi:outer membrane receptor protein involved in Fe transport